MRSSGRAFYAVHFATSSIMVEAQPPSNDVVSSVLSMYSSEVTSHASLIVGFIVALFTLAQARQPILNVGFPEWGFEFVVLTIVFAVIYSMLRLVLYGSLSGVLMGSSLTGYTLYLEATPRGLLDHAEVNQYAMYELMKYSWARSNLYRPRGAFSKYANRKAAFWIQPPMIVSFGIAWLFTSFMFGISAEWFELLVVLVVLIVAANLISIRVAVPSPKEKAIG